MNEEYVTKLWEDYRNATAYQASVGISASIPKFVDFYEGRQWPKETKRTKSMPRPVINIIKMICRNKKSAILSVPVRIRYHSDAENIDVDKFNDFADYIGKEIGLERLYKTAMHDGVVKGTYALHFYWDTEADGLSGKRDGGLRGECIDPLHIFVANPCEVDEQKQKWIMIVSREDVDALRDKADDDVDKDEIVGDECEDRYSTVEQDGERMATVLTRYFRKDGEVFCEKSTKSCVVNKPFPIAPDVDAAMRQLRGEEDAPNNALPDDGKELKKRAKAPLYPIVIGQYDVREGSIYGIGEVEGLIANQQAINFNIGMSLLNVQQSAWGKYIAKPNALRGQAITDEPGQLLTDYSNTGDGIKHMATPPLSSQPMALVESITQLTRAVTGSSEVMTGETVGANMSGAAIAQLQSQAQMPIEELRDMFWLNVEKVGKVLAQFYRLFYAGESYTYPDSSGEGTKRGTFHSAEYRDADFSVVVEATSGTRASSAGDINMLDTLLAKGGIDVETYIKAYPSDAISNKEELLRGIRVEQNGQMMAIMQQNKQYEAQVAQLTELVAKQNAVVEKTASIIRENKSLKEMLSALYSEATQKIRAANEQVAAGNAKLRETVSDAQAMAEALAPQFETPAQNETEGGMEGGMQNMQNGSLPPM